MRADHSLGVSPRPVPVASDREQDLPANGVVFPRELVPHFADANLPLSDCLTTAQALNRGEHPRAAHLRGLDLTVANPASSRRTPERRETKCTSTCPALPHQPPIKVPVAQHANVDVTAAEEPVVRNLAAVRFGARPHRATKPTGVKPKDGPPSQRASALPSSFTPSMPCYVSLITAPEELCKPSIHGAPENVECCGRDSTEREWVPQRVPPPAIVLAPTGCRELRVPAVVYLCLSISTV